MVRRLVHHAACFDVFVVEKIGALEGRRSGDIGGDEELGPLTAGTALEDGGEFTAQVFVCLRVGAQGACPDS